MNNYYKVYDNNGEVQVRGYVAFIKQTDANHVTVYGIKDTNGEHLPNELEKLTGNHDIGYEMILEKCHKEEEFSSKLHDKYPRMENVEFINIIRFENFMNMERVRVLAGLCDRIDGILLQCSCCTDIISNNQKRYIACLKMNQLYKKTCSNIISVSNFIDIVEPVYIVLPRQTAETSIVLSMYDYLVNYCKDSEKIDSEETYDVTKKVKLTIDTDNFILSKTSIVDKDYKPNLFNHIDSITKTLENNDVNMENLTVNVSLDYYVDELIALFDYVVKYNKYGKFESWETVQRRQYK